MSYKNIIYIIIYLIFLPMIFLIKIKYKFNITIKQFSIYYKGNFFNIATNEM